MTIYSEFVSRVGSTEARIISEVVRRALGFGWLVTVNDGEEDAVVGSNVEDRIFEEIGHTDETVLRFTHVLSEDPMFHGLASRSALGFVYFVHGNDDDVLADCSDNEPMAELTAGVY